MKRTLLSLLTLLVALTGTAQTIGEAFYVYRSDGMINTFFRSEVDSMAYSYYDVDSICYDEPVTQVIYTPDSIYRIPLAMVDSVGFVTPETKYQPNVVKLEGTIRDYIIGSDSLTVFFRSDTPSGILPKIGDKLVTTEMSGTFMGGFLGQVEVREQKGDSIALHCNTIGIEEAFECFYYTTDGESQNGPNKVKATGWDWSGYYAPGPFAFSFTSFLNANIKPIDCPIKFLKLPPKLDITIAPTFQSKGSIIVHPFRGVVISVDIKQHTSFIQDFAVSGGIGTSHDFAPDLIPMYPILPFVSIYGEMGFFLKANMNLSLEGHWNQSLNYDVHYEASYLPVTPMPISTTIPKFTINNVNLTTDHNEEFMIDGSVSGGLYGEIGIVPLYSKYIAKAGFRFEAGIKIGGNAMLYNSDGENSLFSTSTYERLKAGELYVKPFCTVSLQAKLLDIGKANVNLFKKEWDLCRFKLVPDFENTTLTRDEDIPSILWASTTASGSTIVPSALGFMLFEGEEEDGIKRVNSHNYWNPLGYPYPYYELFEQKSLMKSYTVYPTVNLFGIEMLAKPSAEIGIRATPITLNAEDITETSAKVWGKIEGHELLDGTTKFGLGYIDAGSTGTVMYDAPSIDADGVFSVEFKALKPKTKYKYFAYLEIDGKRIEGEYKEFKTKWSLCPDDHHPHAIDLGLPSGTKWCCCNVGASIPEGYGGYYAWGETSEKGYYRTCNYKYAVVDNNGYWYDSATGQHYRYTNIGSDIAGTGYDAATVNMGAPWRMPSHDQQMELLNNCSRQWIQLNGVNGIFVTGPNGGQIFLPAAGYGGEDLYGAGFGYYWSSSRPYYDDDACGMKFGSVFWDWFHSNPADGISVRAICQ